MFNLILRFIFCIFLGTFLWVFLDSLYKFSKLKKYQASSIPVEMTNIFVKIYTVLPSLIAEYLNYQRSEEFKEHGLILFCGEQGSGKSMSMTYNINRLIMKYPCMKVYTNYGLLCEDAPLTNYKDILFYDNGFDGICFGFDEIQGTFASRSWSDFPIDFLGGICQNRKAHRVIFGTAQSVSQVDKAIRLQTRFYVTNKTFFTFLTVSLWYKPYFDFEGNLEKSRLKKIQIFLQEDALRYQYDTFAFIKSIRGQV